MLVGLIAHPVDLVTVFVHGGGFANVVAVALNITMQVGDSIVKVNRLEPGRKAS